MSTITSMKHIDIQRHAIIELLDAMGIDIDPKDGHLYFAEDPSIPIALNERYLRVEIGVPDKRYPWAVIQPLNREDHAQYLMTLALYAQVFADMMDPEEAKVADFNIDTQNVIMKDDETGEDKPMALVKIKRGSDKEDEDSGVGWHVDSNVAIIYAVLNFMVRTGYITEDQEADLKKDIGDAWKDYNAISEMKSSAKRKILRERRSQIYNFENEDDSEDNSELIYDALGDAREHAEIENDEPIPDEDWYKDIHINPDDFPVSTGPRGLCEMVEQDFTMDEYDKLFAPEPVKENEEPEPPKQDDNFQIFEEEPIIQQPVASPVVDTGFDIIGELGGFVSTDTTNQSNTRGDWFGFD